MGSNYIKTELIFHARCRKRDEVLVTLNEMYKRMLSHELKHLKINSWFNYSSLLYFLVYCSPSRVHLHGVTIDISRSGLKYLVSQVVHFVFDLLSRTYHKDFAGIIDVLSLFFEDFNSPCTNLKEAVHEGRKWRDKTFISIISSHPSIDVYGITNNGDVAQFR